MSEQIVHTPNLERLESLTNILEVKENNREKILTFMNSAPCLCFIKSVETGKYEFVNKVMCETMGKSENEIVGKTDWQLLSFEEATLRTSYDIRILKERKPITYISKRDGKLFILTKFLVVNGSESIGCFGLELPALFTLESFEKPWK